MGRTEVVKLALLAVTALGFALGFWLARWVYKGTICVCELRRQMEERIREVTGINPDVLSGDAGATGREQALRERNEAVRGKWVKP